jgi:hypothetical protein
LTGPSGSQTVGYTETDGQTDHPWQSDRLEVTQPPRYLVETDILSIFLSLSVDTQNTQFSGITNTLSTC